MPQVQKTLSLAPLDVIYFYLEYPRIFDGKYNQRHNGNVDESSPSSTEEIDMDEGGWKNEGRPALSFLRI